jgi:hypothetical protein
MRILFLLPLLSQTLHLFNEICKQSARFLTAVFFHRTWRFAPSPATCQYSLDLININALMLSFAMKVAAGHLICLS